MKGDIYDGVIGCIQLLIITVGVLSVAVIGLVLKVMGVF